VRHAGGARGEDGEVGAALALQFELRALQALADLVVADAEVLVGGTPGGICQRRELAVKRLDIREILGTKTMREITLK